jgi:hypothetical protein
MPQIDRCNADSPDAEEILATVTEALGNAFDDFDDLLSWAMGNWEKDPVIKSRKTTAPN